MSARVLITGGGSGIGRAMAQAFAATGAQVCVIDRDPAALGQCPRAWRCETADAASEGDMTDVISRLEADWGGLDVLCANAGTAGPTAAVEDVDLADWRMCVTVNLEAAFLAAKLAAPIMKRQGSGSVILTSSTAGLHGYPNRAPYAAAKWGIIGLMKTLAMELGPFGIRANAICPGAVEGPRMDGVIAREALLKGVTEQGIRDGYAAGSSMRSFVTAQDVAQTAVFLGSPAARRISGQMIAIDGHTENPTPAL